MTTTTAVTTVAAMTTDTAALTRAWIAALTVAALVLLWSILARAPFPASTRTAPTSPAPLTQSQAADPRLTALDLRERALRLREVAVRRRHDVRWAAYRRELDERQSRIRAALAAPAAPSSGPVFSTSSASTPAEAPAAASTRSS
jgi:hypothetical protein